MSARRSREREDKRMIDSRRSICGCLGCAPGVEYWYIRLVNRYTTHIYIYMVYIELLIYTRACLETLGPGVGSDQLWPGLILLYLTVKSNVT